MFDVALYWKYLHCKHVIEIFEREFKDKITENGGIKKIHLAVRDGGNQRYIPYACADCHEGDDYLVLVEDSKCCASEDVLNELLLASTPLIGAVRRIVIYVQKDYTPFKIESPGYKYSFGQCNSPVSSIYPSSLSKDTVDKCTSVLWDALDYLVRFNIPKDVVKLAGMLDKLCVESNSEENYTIRVSMLGMLPTNPIRRSDISVSFKGTQEGMVSGVLELAGKLETSYSAICYEEVFLQKLYNSRVAPEFTNKTDGEWRNIVRAAKVVELVLGRSSIDTSIMEPHRVCGCLYALEKVLPSDEGKSWFDVLCGLRSRYKGVSLSKCVRDKVATGLSCYVEYIKYGKSDCSVNEVMQRSEESDMNNNNIIEEAKRFVKQLRKDLKMVDNDNLFVISMKGLNGSVNKVTVAMYDDLKIGSLARERLPEMYAAADSLFKQAKRRNPDITSVIIMLTDEFETQVFKDGRVLRITNLDA